MTRRGDASTNIRTKDLFAALREKRVKRPTPKEKFLSAEKTLLLLRRWKEFLSHAAAENETPEIMDFADLKVVPEMDVILTFFVWMVRTKPGQSNRPRCIGTLQREWDIMQRALLYQVGHKFKGEDIEGVKGFIKELAKTENASSFADPKGLAGFVVVEDVINYLWVCDEHVFKHPRERLQLAFAILVLGSLGLRPGELVQSNLYPGSNDGLKYKDCALQFDRNGTLSLLLTRRLMKTKRNELDKVQEHTIFEIPGDRKHCPLTLFVALAVADGALEMSQVSDRSVAPGANASVITLKKEMLEVPVLRSTKDQCEISSQAILKYSSLEYMLVKLGERAGYKEPLSTYCFRRGVGNALDKVVTSAERQRVMGHSSEKMFQNYMSKVCPVDSQAITQGTETRKEEIELLRSMSFHRNLDAPKPHTAFLTKSGKRSRRAFDSTEEYEQERYAKRHKLQQERAEFFSNPQAAQSASSSEPEEDRFEYVTAGSMVRVRPKPSPWIAILLRYDHPRAEVVRNFYERESNTPLLLEEALSPLVSMGNPSPFRAFYPLPEVSSDTKECPWCGKSIINIPPLQFNNHLLRCFKKQYHAANSAKAASACLFRTVDPSESKLDPKSSLPLSKESYQIRSSACRWRSCTFDFVNKSIVKIAKHMEDHIQYSSGGRCGWNGCTLPSASVLEMEAHLLKAHGAPSRSTMDDKAFFCHQCASWSTSSCAWENHCEQHLKDLRDPYCGSIIFKGVVIFAALCPFCLGGEVKASRRYHQLQQTTIKPHIMDHVRDYRRPFPCPHPLCKKDREYSHQGYLDHLGDVHGIFLRVRGNKSQGGTDQESGSGSTSGSEQEVMYEEIDLTED